MTEQLRWGLLGTARIAQTAFLPALRTAGHSAVVVGGRDIGRTQLFASENGVNRAVQGYEAVISDSGIDAVYIPLPNSMHAEWSIKALEAGKAVLCEKSLCADVNQARLVIEAARSSSMPLWEAFAFPFHRQYERIVEILSNGAIGELREIQSHFHFQLTDPTNIRLESALGGGALYDVGCYPIRLAQLLFGANATAATAIASWQSCGIDIEMQGVVEYSFERRVLFSCGMLRDTGTYARLVGELGEVRITNPFHARGFDTLEILSAGKERVIENAGTSEPSFTALVRHIAAVLRDETDPRHLAVEDSLSTELALDMVMRSAKTGVVSRTA
jgi:predicted dehydrogenase